MKTKPEINQLATLLATTGRTKAWAARELNCSYPHFHDVLNGKRNLSEDMSKKIKELLVKMATPVAV